MRLLGAPARAVRGRRVGQVLAADARANPLPRGLLRLGRHAHRVGPHVRDETLGTLGAEVDALVELLRDRHRLLRREAELAARLLLERRGDEGRRGVPAALAPRDGLDHVARALERRDQRLGFRLVRDRRLLAPDLLERGHERRWERGREPRVERPVLDGDERLDLTLPVDDEPHGDRLDAAGREAPLDLLPEQGRQAVAHEAVEHPARLLRVHLSEVDLAGLRERRPHRALGDLVEGDPMDVLPVDVELLRQVPADRLALAVGVGRDVERVHLLGRLLQLVEHLLLAGRDDVLRLEPLLRVHAELRLRQIADVAHRRLHDEARVQVLLDRLHLRGRLHNHQRPLGHYALLAPTVSETHRCPASCRTHPWSSRATSAVAARAAASPLRAISSSMC